jgi:uncharacterized tellurite resistance protein B-like protein
MIKSFKDFFSTSIQPDNAPSSDSLHLAAAALMIELIYTDDKVMQAEKEQLTRILQNTWHIEKDKIDSLIKIAEREIDNANDFYQFTRLLNDNFNYAKKCQLVESLWQLAFADNELNKYEEAMIRKIADLLYVQHEDFIRTKQKALAQRAN